MVMPPTSRGPRDERPDPAEVAPHEQHERAHGEGPQDAVAEDLPRAGGLQRGEVEREQTPDAVGEEAVDGALAQLVLVAGVGPAAPLASAGGGAEVTRRSRCRVRAAGRRGRRRWPGRRRCRRRPRPGRGPGRRRSAARPGGRCPSARATSRGCRAARAAKACDGSSSVGVVHHHRTRLAAGRLGLGDELHRAVALAHQQPAVALDADADRLAGAQPDDAGLLLAAVLEHVEGAVVEDRAVLVDLDQRGAAVLGGRLEDAR